MGDKTKTEAHKRANPAMLVMLIVIVSAFILMILPAPAGLSPAGQKVLGIAIIAIGLWGTEVLPVGVTGMLVVLALMVSGGASSYQEALIGFAKPVAYFLIAVLTIGLAVQKSGLAEEISPRIPGQGHELATLLLFPDEGRVAASERFIPKNFLGQPFLTDAYRVDYTHDDQHVQLFVVETGSPTEAQSHLTRLEDFYRGSNQAQVTLETTEDPPTLIVDGPSKAVVFQLDHRLGGATGMQSMEAGRAAARALAEKMKG